MIELGDVVTISTKIYDGSTPPVLADPGGISCVVTSESDNVSLTFPTPVHDGTGLYHVNFTTIQTGRHDVTWTTTGVNAGVLTDAFDVEIPTFGIVSLSEVKAHLRITRSNDDEILRSLILAASDLCESSEGTGKVWRRTVITNEQHNGGTTSITFNKRPVYAVTALSIDGTAQTVSNFDVETWRITSPFNTFGDGSRKGTVLISYVAGGQPVPAGVRDGMLELVRHLYAPHRGGSNLPRQEEPDYTQSAGYLIPNRVMQAWHSASDSALG